MLEADRFLSQSGRPIREPSRPCRCPSLTDRGNGWVRYAIPGPQFLKPPQYLRFREFRSMCVAEGQAGGFGQHACRSLRLRFCEIPAQPVCRVRISPGPYSEHASRLQLTGNQDKGASLANICPNEAAGFGLVSISNGANYVYQRTNL